MQDTSRRRRDDSRARLIAAAARLFSRRGVEATAVEDVAAAAGVVKGTFYYNFEGKDDLVLAVASSAVAADFERLAMRVADDPPLRLLAKALDLAARYGEREPRIASAAYRIAARRGLDGTAGGRPRFRDFLTPIVTRGQREGVLRRDVPAAVLADHLGMAYVAEAFAWFATRRAPSLRARARRALRLFVEGARAR